MSATLESTLARRFHLARAPTLEARVSGTAPILFSRMRAETPQSGRSLIPRPEEAFTFQVPLIPARFSEFRYAGRTVSLPRVQEPGYAYLFDLSERPTVALDTVFDNVRCYISQRTIDDLAYERGLRRVGGLAQRCMGERDPVLFHLASLLLPALAAPAGVSAAFVEYVALAFHEHVITAYGGVARAARRRHGGLAPWQIRRALDFMESQLDRNPGICEMARECRLSASHFAEAFRQSMNTPPHQWLLRRRVERSKGMLRDTTLSLAGIAASCGFCDQSHFTRVFARLEGCGPAAWRWAQRSR